MKFSEFKNGFDMEALVTLLSEGSDHCQYCPLKEQCWKTTENNPDDDRTCKQYLHDTLEEG